MRVYLYMCMCSRPNAFVYACEWRVSVGACLWVGVCICVCPSVCFCERERRECIGMYNVCVVAL